MGREIRRVPANWEHPKTQIANHLRGRMEECYQPLFNYPYSEKIGEWIQQHQLWEAGQHPDQLDGSVKDYRYYAQWGGNAPDVEYYRPDWKTEEMTWWQVYETVSEGTPVTPPFATREELVEYLVANGDFGGDKWSRKSAMEFVKQGFATSMVWTAKNGLQTGAEALGNET